jgi:hypothetical protein
MDVIITKNDTIYKLAYTHGMNPNPPSGLSYWMINKSDHAIVEFQFTAGFSSDQLIYQVLVRFKKIDQKYYPYFIRSIQPRLINRNFDYKEYDIETIWFDDVYTGKFNKVKMKEAVAPMDNENYKNVDYDSTAWNQLEFFKNHPLAPHIKSSLERNGTLEDQFKRKE